MLTFSKLQSALQALPDQPSPWCLSQRVNVPPIVSQVETEAIGDNWSQWFGPGMMTNLLCDSCHWYNPMAGETLTYTGLVRETDAMTYRRNTMQKLCFSRNRDLVAAVRHKLGTWTAGWFHVQRASLATFRSYVNSQMLPESWDLPSGLGRQIRASSVW